MIALRLLLAILLLATTALAQTIVTFAGLPPSHRAAIDSKYVLEAPFNAVYGLLFDRNTGRLLLHDGQVVYRIEPDDSLTAIVGIGRDLDGDIADGTLASNLRLSILRGMAQDSAGNLYLADAALARIFRVTPDGIVTTFLGGDGTLSSPRGMIFDAKDNLYVADVKCACILRVSPAGAVSTFYALPNNGSPRYFEGLTMDSSGSVLATEYAGDAVLRIAPDGTATTIVSELKGPTDVQVDSQGNVWVTETRGHRLLMISPDGTITGVAGTGQSGFSGDGGPAQSAQLFSPAQITFDSSGNLYLADYGNRRVRKVSASGLITTIAGSGVPDPGSSAQPVLQNPSSVAFDSNGVLYVAELSGNRVRRITPDGTITTAAALPGPTTLSFDNHNSLYIASITGHISKLDPQGNVINIAGIGTGTGPVRSQGDGGPAVAATLNEPKGVAVDASGNVYIADTSNARVRKVDTNGVISTVAGPGQQGVDYWNSLAFDLAGSLYVGMTHAAQNDSYSVISRLNADGSFTRVAGNGHCLDPFLSRPLNGVPVIEAPICTVLGIRFDSRGNLYFTDPSYGAVFRVGSDGAVVRVAGSSAALIIGDGGPALNANLGGGGGYSSPADVAIDAKGNLFIPQSGSGRIREVLANPLTAHVVPGPITSSLTEILQITTDVAEPLPYIVRIQPGVSWLTANRSTGQTGEPLTLQFHTAGLASGTYQTTVAVFVPSATPSEIDIPVTIRAP